MDQASPDQPPDPSAAETAAVFVERLGQPRHCASRPSLRRLRLAGGPTGPAPRGRRQLPPDIAEFTGRDQELRTIVELAAAGTPVAGATPIGVIEGMAGVGKTRLAVRAAHTLIESGRFDGSLHVDLR